MHTVRRLPDEQLALLVAVYRQAVIAKRRQAAFIALAVGLAIVLVAMPRVLALAIHTMGALGKQFAEVIENIDMKPVEGVTAAGGNFAAIARFAVVPQVLSNFTSYALLRFEINVRGAAVMG